MLGPLKRRAPDHPIAHSLDELVPADHFYRHLDAALDLSFVRDWVRDLYADCGRPSIDPVVFFKLQLVLFFEGVRSERHLMRVVADRLSVRWYLRYDLDESLPDHSSPTRIRARSREYPRPSDHVRTTARPQGEEAEPYSPSP
jgi:transposase